ncbi:CYFA0S04e06238g1_1 [Cyberlindnera fabianii]|uniref:CYFA0S04e06238g1_1 n=1 Tax=Cyberlindnera fabianii TaxID=36022 RepID=A0A061AXU0_CYBFA|nr:Growth regulation protein [Cyberlindnera fabianii]CDR40222.1 CYFA0S04e06238g1_1 [Cyberlindnera fabianii]
MSHANILTQVEENPLGYSEPQLASDADMNSIINLNIRGTMFQITRDELMNLPESILLCLFPNGVFVDIHGNTITTLTEEDIVYVNFDPTCFEYIIESFNNAAKKLPVGTQTQVYDAYQTPNVEVLSEKPSIIVLREDIDYYIVPPHKGISPQGIRAIKQAAGSYLVSRMKVFEGLGYAPGKKLGPAEEHLLDMLCSSGFDIETLWGHRSQEPGKTVLTSLALVDLKHPNPPEPESPESPALNPVTSEQSLTPKQSRRSRIAELANNAARSASRSVSRNRSRTRKSAGTSSKLLLFWRKPARKCWWSNDVVELKVPGILGPNGMEETLTIHVHIRRVWTLELSVMGVH